jgi:hypothetical protein
MSEFSISFHIRTSSVSTTEQRLRKAKMSGLIFGPTNGWLTFVPYLNSSGLPYIHDVLSVASAIAQVAAAPVLQFQCTEDHGWTLALAIPGQPAPAFLCTWDQGNLAISPFDQSSLEGIVDLSVIGTFLTAERGAADGQRLAYDVADAIGLPLYRWLSPDYIESDTEHFIKAGARKLGRKPARPKETSVSPPIRLTLPDGGVSAREALGLLKPMMTWCRPPWALRSLSGSSQQGWDFRFYHPGLRETVRGYVASAGYAGFKSLGRGPDPISEEEMERRLIAWRADPDLKEIVRQIEAAKSLPTLPMALPNQWLDSNDALAIAAEVQTPRELGEISANPVVALDRDRDPPARWSILCRSVDLTNRISWCIELDAQTGTLLREVLSKPGEGHESWIISPWRERIAGGAWKDL